MSLSKRVLRKAINLTADEDADVKHALRHLRRSTASLIASVCLSALSVAMVTLLAWFVLHAHGHYTTQLNANIRIKGEAEDAWHRNGCAHGHTSVVPCDTWDKQRLSSPHWDALEAAASHMTTHFWFFQFTGCGDRCTIWVTSIINMFSYTFILLPLLAIFLVVFYSQEVWGWIRNWRSKHTETKEHYEGLKSRRMNALDTTGSLSQHHD